MDIYYKVLRNYRQIKKFDDRTDFLSKVIQKCIANATVITGLTHDTAALTVFNNTYITHINNASGGDETFQDIRDKYYDLTWLPAVDVTAHEVELLADGDKVIIDKSGFDPTASGHERSVLPIRMHLEVESRKPGELSYKSDTENVGKGATYILICGTRSVTNYKQNADGSIEIETTGPAKIRIIQVRNKKGTIKGLPSEEKLSCYIVAVNAAGTGPLSQEAKIIIQ
jgi:hypothetical protein